MLTEQLHERLKAVADSAAQLPIEAQNKLAEEIALALENALWDAQLRAPHHLAKLRELAEEARSGSKLPLPTPRDMGDQDAIDADSLPMLDNEQNN